MWSCHCTSFLAGFFILLRIVLSPFRSTELCVALLTSWMPRSSTTARFTTGPIWPLFITIFLSITCDSPTTRSDPNPSLGNPLLFFTTADSECQSFCSACSFLSWKISPCPSDSTGTSFHFPPYDSINCCTQTLSSVSLTLTNCIFSLVFATVPVKMPLWIIFFSGL